MPAAKPVSDNARKLRALRERAGYDLRELARRIGWGHSRYQHYETVIKKKYLPAEFVELVAPHLIGRGTPPITEDEIFALVGRAAHPASGENMHATAAPEPNAEIAFDRTLDLPQIDHMPFDLPVRGRSAGSSAGDFTMDGGPIGYVRRPAALKNREAFVCYVDGPSMVPWRQPREPVVAEVRRRPLEGEHVVVEMKSEGGAAGRAAHIKRLVKLTATKIRLGQYNPKREFDVPMSQVERIYRVVEWHELLPI